jgi:hypothetical protein
VAGGVGRRWWELAAPVGSIAVLIVILIPAWLQIHQLDEANSAAISAQRHSDLTQGADVQQLLRAAAAHGPGRLYAGQPTNWGVALKVGSVPVFKYLAAADADEVGFTLRTASLMTPAEYFFDPSEPKDYSLFGVRYLLLHAGAEPPIRATQLTSRGPYSLWMLPKGNYVHLGQLEGRLAETRSDIGIRSVSLLTSDRGPANTYEQVAFGTRHGRRATWSTTGKVRGTTTQEHVALGQGRVRVNLRLRRAGVLVLSASFDPGWHATIDARRTPTIMVAPALIGVRVPAGVHTVSFIYSGYDNYPLLFFVSAVVIVLAAVADARARKRRDPFEEVV